MRLRRWLSFLFTICLFTYLVLTLSRSNNKNSNNNSNEQQPHQNSNAADVIQQRGVKDKGDNGIANLANHGQGSKSVPNDRSKHLSFNMTAPKNPLGKAKRCKFPRHIAVRLLPGPRKRVQINHLNPNYTPTACTSQPILLLVINSRPENDALRRAIRQSWGDGSRFTTLYGAPYAWRVVFAVGLSTNDDTNNVVINEYERYKDILIGNFIDTPYNISLKTLMGIHWCYIYCQPLYLYKGNDDAFVNAPRMFEFIGWLVIRRKLSKLWFGHVEHDWRYHVPNRDPNSSYYVSLGQFNGSYYPAFVRSFGMVMSRDVARDIVIAAGSVPVVPRMDHIYLSLLARKAGINLSHNKRFYFRWPMLRKSVHYTRHDVNAYLVISRIANANQHIRMNVMAKTMMKIEHCWYTRILDPDPDS